MKTFEEKTCCQSDMRLSLLSRATPRLSGLSQTQRGDAEAAEAAEAPEEGAEAEAPAQAPAQADPDARPSGPIGRHPESRA